MNRLILFPILACLVALASCKEDKLDLYEDESNVFFTLQRWDLAVLSTGADANIKFPFEYEGKTYDFEWGNDRAVFDSLSKTMYFAPDEVRKDTVFIPVSLMGFMADTDRDVSFTVKASSTALEGVHYRILRSYMPAGKTKGAIVVEILRDGLADNVTRHIDLRIEPNEYFSTNFRTIHKSSIDKTPASTLDFRVTISNDVLPPPLWLRDLIWNNYLGKYSKKKFLLVLDLSGGNPADFYPDNVLDQLSLAKLGGYSTLLKMYLTEQQQAGTPVLEDDLTPMQGGIY